MAAQQIKKCKFMLQTICLYRIHNPHFAMYGAMFLGQIFRCFNNSKIVSDIFDVLSLWDVEEIIKLKQIQQELLSTNGLKYLSQKNEVFYSQVPETFK